MIRGGIHSVAVVGAGVAGLAAAKTLIGEGMECTVFERGERLGGVWADGYVNFGVQVQKELYEIPDWPLPPAAPDFTPGPTFQQYLEGYCDHFGVRPDLHLNTRVLSVGERRDGSPGWTVTVESGGTETSEDFDLVVVATGLYSETPNIPEYPGMGDFAGRILHISDLKTPDPLRGRRVAVVGYGKSATDAVGEAAAVSEAAHLIFREAHWPVPRKLAGLLPFKWGMLHRLTAALVPPYMRQSGVSRWVHSIGKPVVWIFWRLVELLLRVQFRLDTPIAQGRSLVPSTPVEFDCFGESTMVPRPGLMDLIGSGRIVAHRTEIERFKPDGLVLRDGAELDVDCVLFGTGWINDYDYLSSAIRSALHIEEDGFYLYRHMLHPDLPNLVFLGRASTFLSVVTYNVQARWLAETVAGRVALPDRETMLDEIERMKRWKRSWMPFSPARSARILLHMGNYHDELLRDFGADPFRKKGLFAPLKELLAPYQSSDYRDIASGEWRQNAPAEQWQAPVSEAPSSQ